MTFKYVAVLAFVAVTFAQDFEFQAAPRPAPARIQPGYSGPSSSAPRPTPVAILKQINRHNEDGSYTYGYEGADGAFKIETKLPTGEVKGKYGYVDDTGKVRVVEYGATKYGFEPAGEGITVAPPTLVDETTDKSGNLLPEFSGSYYDQQDQQQYAPAPVRPAPRPAPRPRPQATSFDYTAPQTFEPAPQPIRSPSPVPPRALIPGASPLSSSHSFDFGPPARPAPARSFAPAPRPISYEPAPSFEPEPAAAPRPAPRITYAPAPQAERQFIPAARPAPQYAPRPAPVSRGGILDQLEKDYGLPSNGAAPVHDISFGYY